MVEEWEKLWRDQIGKMFSSLSASLSSFLPFPSFTDPPAAGSGVTPPLRRLQFAFFFFCFFFVCKEETTWSIWSRLERGGGGHPLLILGYSPDERVCSLHGRAHGHTGRDPWFVVLRSRQSVLYLCTVCTALGLLCNTTRPHMRLMRSCSCG